MKLTLLSLVILSLAICGAAICGWVFGIPALYSFGIENATMKPSTASMICILDVSILLFRSRRSIIAYSLSILLWIACVLTILQYLTASPLLPLFRYMDEHEVASLPTVIGILLTVTGLLFINFKRASLGQVLCSIVALQMFSSLMGLTFGVGRLYYFGAYSAVSLPTALALLFSAISAVLLQPHEGWINKILSKRAAGYTARFAIIYFLVVTPVYVWGYLHLIKNPYTAVKADIIFLILGLITVSVPLFYILLKKLDRLDWNLEQRKDEVQRVTDQLIETNAHVIEQNSELAANNEDLNSIFHMITHDLKTPITGLQASLQLLQRRLSPKERPEEVKLLTSGLNSVEKLKTTISELSDLIKSKAQLGNDEIIDLKDMLDGIRSDLAGMIESADATLNFSLAGQQIRYDRVSLLSILQNLISNAVKYHSPDRRPVIEVSIFNMQHKTYLTVSDNGLGIPESKISELFTSYRRFHTHVEGTGIGLYLVKKLVEKRGGTIEVESSEGKGTKLTLYLGKDLLFEVGGKTGESDSKLRK